MHATGVVDLRVLLGDDAPVHLFGDLDEPDPPVQHDDGQRQPGGRPQHRGGQFGQMRAQFDDHPGRARRGQAGQIGVAGGGIGQRQTGGEDQFATLEQVGEVGEFADVHPTHRPVQRPVADDLGLAGPQDGQGEHLGDGRLH